MRSADDRFEYRGRNGEPLQAGASLQDAHRFAFRCRSNPETFCDLNIRGRGHDIPNRSWTLSGTTDAPTLHPSVNCHGDKCWHGFIRDGVFYKTDQKTREDKQ